MPYGVRRVGSRDLELPGVDHPAHAGSFGGVTEVGRRRGVGDEIQARRVLGHGIVGQSGHEDDLVVAGEILLVDLEDVLGDDADVVREVIAEPEQVDDVDLVSALQQTRPLLNFNTG